MNFDAQISSNFAGDRYKTQDVLVKPPDVNTSVLFSSDCFELLYSDQIKVTDHSATLRCFFILVPYLYLVLVFCTFVNVNTFREKTKTFY